MKTTIRQIFPKIAPVTRVFKDRDIIEKCKYSFLDNYDIAIHQVESLECLFPEEDRHFIDPEILEEYLDQESKKNNSLVVDYSQSMRVFVLNTKGYKYEAMTEVYRSVRGSSS